MRWLSQGTLCCILWLIGHEVAIAQLVPDSTLGAESSIVAPLDAQTVQIEGGLVRNSNLFHSFSQFNIDQGQRVYFANPTDSVNIFSRVTGETASTLFGTLGILGDANLFLLNPNGILFGSQARLDIQGSFLATTADRLLFPGGETFSATTPEMPPLLTVNVPLGIQFGDPSQGTITNTGQLVAGNDLTLLGHQLYLEGQLVAGNNLRLQAEDVITIRDTSIDAFRAQSGRELTIQGNQGIDIWALQHLDHPPFISGGHLTVISDGPISGDAHFDSGGGISFVTSTGEPAQLVSQDDPIIMAVGDVVFGDYIGASLKVETTGSIRGGAITITGPDTTLTVDGTGSDEDLLASGPTAILRAGVNSISGTVRPSQLPDGTSFILEPATTPASIELSSIDTSSPIGDAVGPIILAADGDITITGDVSSSSFSEIGDAANGGDIAIQSIVGDITLDGDVNASSEAFVIGSTGDSGNISIASISGNIVTNGKVKALAFAAIGNAGDGGQIEVQAEAGNVTLNNAFETFSTAKRGDGGNGGDISIFGETILVNERLNAFARADIGVAGDAGDISLTSTTGDILLLEGAGLKSWSISSSDNAGNGGNINLLSTSGNIFADVNLEAFSESKATDTDAGDGGQIVVQADSGDITINSVFSTFSSTLTGDSGNGGNIFVSGEAIALNNRFNTFTRTGAGIAGDAGDISLTSNTGDILLSEGNGLKAFSFSTFGTAGDGGNINLSSGSGNIITDVILESFSESRRPSGIAGNAGDISIASTSGNISINRVLRATSFSRTTGVAGDGGDISIASTSGNIVTQKRLTTQSYTLAGDAGNGGDIEISSVSGDIRTNEIEASSFTFPWTNDFNVDEAQIVSPTGNGGDISIASVSGNITANGFVGSSSFSRYGSTGNAGNIALITQTGALDLGDNAITAISVSEIDAETGSGGNVLLQAPSVSNTEVSTVSSGGASGDVAVKNFAGDLQLNNLRLVTSGQIELLNPEGSQVLFLDSSRFDQSGNTIIESSGGLTISNVVLLSDANRAADAGNVEISSLGNLQINDSQILVNTNEGSTGNGGSVLITSTESISIANDTSEINSNTGGTGRAGNIELTAPNITLMNGALLSATTSGEGTAGNIILDAADSLIVDNSTVESNTDVGSIGLGGNILIGREIVEHNGKLTPRQGSSAVLLRNNGTIAVDSAGTSGGGNIELAAERLTLDNGSTITATTAAGIADGGNLTFNLEDFLLLRNGSAISTTAGTDGTGGNGGNITINIPKGVIVAVPDENSDITANAFAGDGGRVEIEAIQLIGIVPRSTPTPLSDITASSEQGTPGTVTSNLSALTPSTEAIDLPDIPGAEAIGQGCQLNGSQTSEFFNTGRSGIVTGPGQPLEAEDLWRDLRPVENASEALVEATGWQLDTTGNVELLSQSRVVGTCASNHTKNE